MRAASQRRGIEVTSISRPIRPSDFREFDLILAMDLQNKEDILSAYERWRFKEPLPPDAPKKVKLMCFYCKKHSESEVPDPYYGGPQGFEKVIAFFYLLLSNYYAFKLLCFLEFPFCLKVFLYKYLEQIMKVIEVICNFYKQMK